ncbi:cobalt-zinc-cadmium efflux system protein [Saccharopolyspora erythraea NRRL 2338]|uniref:Obalt-zinc-cadmium resistance protein n=2 Tax=Saccharopolyspora erythraea TaxID=1836 RepID=A4FN50_SACEN|nr:cation diffusion facilitator family transporter [Saccharopolyspora erythraea]EQD83052.1 cation transporter [Saccharopolyspora erythraea D]PFG99116.1 cobalt-zinc-cadmium efflux system protein [Saccharopolyspora erythraea NRRL 2338]QRK89075.1 cation transporter [Saccharopolyspora erythraea]CAM05475.1 obalt-zinc-cadmium resistance protein [Saccharopolyspora erythraea NRRL 2338]
MGHGHGHGGAADAVSASGRYVRRLGVSFAVLLGFFVLEAVVGFMTSSLALLSDAGHMLTDVLGVGMALAAITTARLPARGGRTFGLYRVEVLAALANAVLLFGVAGYILYEAVGRFQEPPEVSGVPMMLTAAAGLLANLVVFALLRKGASESLNVRGAYLEVLADTLGSIGVLVGGALTTAFGWYLADPIVAVGVGLFVLPRTWKLARQALRILVQQAPEGVDVQKMRAELAELPSVTEVHDLHVWTLTSGMEVASAHLTTDNGADHGGVLIAAQRLLAERYSINHATLQVEPIDCARRCRALTW